MRSSARRSSSNRDVRTPVTSSSSQMRFTGGRRSTTCQYQNSQKKKNIKNVVTFPGSLLAGVWSRTSASRVAASTSLPQSTTGARVGVSAASASQILTCRKSWVVSVERCGFTSTRRTAAYQVSVLNTPSFPLDEHCFRFSTDFVFFSQSTCLSHLCDAASGAADSAGGFDREHSEYRRR